MFGRKYVISALKPKMKNTGMRNTKVCENYEILEFFAHDPITKKFAKSYSIPVFLQTSPSIP
jgi:hypothetical protein